MKRQKEREKTTFPSFLKNKDSACVGKEKKKVNAQLEAAVR